MAEKQKNGSSPRRHTEYVVLVRVEAAGEKWAEYGRVAAPNGLAAVKAATKFDGENRHEAGVYRAVAAASWGEPVHVAVEQTVVTHFEVGEARVAALTPEPTAAP